MFQKNLAVAVNARSASKQPSAQSYGNKSTCSVSLQSWSNTITLFDLLHKKAEGKSSINWANSLPSSKAMLSEKLNFPIIKPCYITNLCNGKFLLPNNSSLFLLRLFRVKLRSRISFFLPLLIKKRSSRRFDERARQIIQYFLVLLQTKIVEESAVGELDWMKEFCKLMTEIVGMKFCWQWNIRGRSASVRVTWRHAIIESICVNISCQSNAQGTVKLAHLKSARGLVIKQLKRRFLTRFCRLDF